MAVFLAVVLIFGAMVSIAVDLGRPEKFWRLFMFFFLNNMTSMFAINGILYGGYFVISIFYFGVILAGNTMLTRIMGIVAVCWAVLVHMGTGAIFGFVEAREAWFSPIKPLEFLSAALTSGMALLIVVTIATFKLTGRDLKKEIINSLANMLMVFIIILFILIAVDKLTHLYAPARDATIYMLSGPFSWIFWFLQIGLVVVVPLAILINTRWRNSITAVAIASLSVVIGIFFERYFLVIPGAAYPMAFYPGTIEGVYGAVGQFPIQITEVGLSVGIFAMLALMFILGLRYLEALPPIEKKEPETTIESPAAITEQTSAA
jgi:Ni/Fe-hydrogenase subunit HybB-like protein